MTPRTFAAQAGIAWLLMGAGFAFGPPEWREARSLRQVGDLAPLRAWGLLFMAIGAIILVGQYWRHPRAGAVVGAVVAALWSASFAVAALPQFRNLHNVALPVLFYVLVVCHVAIAGDPRRLLRRRHPWRPRP